MSGNVVGWDIGGAHLKAAVLDEQGKVLYATQRACPLWLGISKLDQAFGEILSELPGICAHHAVTMTGELVDLFPGRHEGVRRLLHAVGENLSQNDVRVFAGERRFLALDEVGVANLESIASANWLASVYYCSNRLDSALFVDIGTTTTDILILHEQRVRARGHSDSERLKSGELVYMGIVRTPVMSIAQQAPFDGCWVGLMAEHFATAADVYRLCGDLLTHADQMPAADGGAKTPAGSRQRLARMLGRDAESSTPEAWRGLAAYLRERQLFKLQEACFRQLSRGI
ncbi:MAG: hydantoinase/oxoprolinase family protein, partial [Pseudomonadota bacterium]